MMPGWADEGESIVQLTPDHFIHSRQGSAGSQFCGLIGFSAGISIRVEHNAGVVGRYGYLLNVTGNMDQLQLLLGRHPGFDLFKRSLHSRLFEHLV